MPGCLRIGIHTSLGYVGAAHGQARWNVAEGDGDGFEYATQPRAVCRNRVTAGSRSVHVLGVSTGMRQRPECFSACTAKIETICDDRSHPGNASSAVAPELAPVVRP